MDNKKELYVCLSNINDSLNAENFERPSMYEIWMIANDHCSINHIRKSLMKHFSIDSVSALDMAVEAIDYNKIYCCSLPKDSAETKIGDIGDIGNEGAIFDEDNLNYKIKKCY